MSNRKIISGYGGRYAVSEDGGVYSCGKELSQSIHNQYLMVAFYVDGKRIKKRVHRLVAEAFIPNPENKPQVNHLDGNKLNNHVSNLEWATAKENVQHALGLGLVPVGEKSVCSLLTDAQVSDLRKEVGKTNRVLAKEYGLSVQAVGYILRGVSWKHLPIGDYSRLHSRLPKDLVVNIREKRGLGWLQKDIAAHYGVHRMTVSQICQGKTYKNI